MVSGPIDLNFLQMEAKNYIIVIQGHFRSSHWILDQNFDLKVKNSRFRGFRNFEGPWTEPKTNFGRSKSGFFYFEVKIFV